MSQITLQVNTLLDQNDGTSNNGLSLRDAIIIANTNRINQYIIELQSGSTYNLTINNATTINETGSKTGDLNIRSGANVTIFVTGGNEPATINASQLTSSGDRVFSVECNANLTLDQINITGGNATNNNNRNASGGGIYNLGFLTLVNSKVDNNTAGDSAGIANDKGVTLLINSTISNNVASNTVGGISNFNDGLLTIINSTIIDNEAGYFGGGIGNLSTLNIINSTIARNQNNNANLNGSGGIYNLSTGDVNLTNVTLINNISASNTGGIYNESTGSVNIANSIIANNSLIINVSTLNPSDLKGQFSGNKNNLIGTIQGATGTIGQGSDITFTEAGITNLNQVLDLQLNDNGGNTLTYALVENSLAINAGNNNNLPSDIIDSDGDNNITEILPYDQRGFKRISGGTVDIGAYEYRFIPTISINDVTITEESNGTTEVTFTIILSETSITPITIDYATANDTATSENDYTATSGTLTFAPEETTKTITVSIIGDTIGEADEIFFINLSNPNNATVIKAQGIATIINDDSIIGDAGNNNLVGYAGNDTIQGLEGNDTLNGGLGADSLEGGEGNDTYIVDNEGDIILETISGTIGGTDLVNASINFILPTNVENLTLTGNSNLNGTGNTGNNKLTGNSGNNLLIGLEGNDTLEGKAGNDTLNGGVGNDNYILNNSNDIIIDSAGTDTVYAYFNYTLLNGLENLILSGSSNLNGTGNTGNNKLTGNSGNNLLIGLEGNDTLEGKAGNDTLNGGAGNDSYILDNSNDVIIDSAGTDTVTTSFNYTLVSALENLTLAGSSNLNGTGNTGNNKLTGNSGNNLLNGLNGNDTLIGGNGNDTLLGGNGNDNLTGGSGLDSFRFNSPSEKTDTITDFSVADDTILVSRTGFGGGLTVGTLASTKFTLGSVATTSAHRFFYDSTNGKLWYDVDGTGATAAVQIATLSNGLTLNNQDIVVF